MKWIQTNCELPRVMMDKEKFGRDYNKELNDIDFVLFHLYASDPWYRQYYKTMRSVHPDRLMILDNSAYEFFIKGEELDHKAYQDAILDLKPDYYIVPDVLMDKEKTVECYGEYIQFTNEVHEKNPKPMFVLQGKYEDDLIDCLYNIRRRFTIERRRDWFNVCIPFHNEFFKYINPSYDIKTEFLDKYSKNEITDDLRYAIGRVEFFKKYFNTFCECNRIHFLGSHCPYEKAFYNKCLNNMDIVCNLQITMDTGYPVKLGYTKQFLGAETKKPDVIIDEFFNTMLNEDIIAYIAANIHMFKQYS